MSRPTDTELFHADVVTQINDLLPDTLQVSHLEREEGTALLFAVMKTYPARNSEGELLRPVLPEPNDHELCHNWVRRAASKIVSGTERYLRPPFESAKVDPLELPFTRRDMLDLLGAAAKWLPPFVRDVLGELEDKWTLP